MPENIPGAAFRESPERRAALESARFRAFEEWAVRVRRRILLEEVRAAGAAREEKAS